MRGSRVGALVAALLVTTAAAAQSAPSLGEPSLSPDGREIAFVSGGDIWSVPVTGGEARLLVSNPATESRPVWSPDGKSLAFTSNRAGSTNLYLLVLATGEVKRLTWADSSETLDGWSRDGRWLYFSSGINDVGRQSDIFRVSVEGGTPLEVSRERYLAEFQGAPSPDGRTLALMARGLSNGQWWRNGHAHIDETELWLKPIDGAGGYRKLLAADAKHAFPMWSPDGTTISYMSDQSGAENLWTKAVSGGAPAQLTHFTSGRVLWPSIGYDGRAIVFERDFGIWRWDAATGRAQEVPIQLRGAPAGEGDTHLNETSFREIALSPDGKKMAVVAHGEVFAAPAKDGGPALRLTHTATAESDLAWSPDSRRLAFLAENGPDVRLMQYDFVTAKTVALSHVGAGPVQSSAYAPDGKSIAYVAGERELRVATLGPDGTPIADRTIFIGALEGRDTAPAWSPDGKWLAFGVTGPKAFRNIFVAPAAGGEARPVSFLANGNTGRRVAWSPDGTYILLDTAQRSEDVKIVRIDLLPHVPKYREDAFQDLFKPADQPDKPSTNPAVPTAPARPPAKPEAPTETASTAAPDAPSDKPGEERPAGRKPPVKPVRIVFEGLRERATALPLGMSADTPVISPDGKTLVFRSRGEGRDALYSYDLDELAHEPPTPHELAAGAKPKGDFDFTPDGKTVFYREGGKIFSSPIEGPKPKPLAVSAELDTSFDAEKMVVFDETWNTLNRRFFDPTFHGKNWAAIRDRFRPQAEGARTGDELRRVINLMIGELNASHSGINKGADDTAAPRAHVGDLGLRFDRAAYEAGRGLVIREVVTLGPVDIAGGVHPVDRLLAVDGAAIGPHDNLDQALLGKVGRRTVLRIAGAGGPRDVVVRPVTVQVAAGLLYRQWVNDRRALVERVSGGKIGYVHIADMSDASLAQLYIDLDAQNQTKQGVVIDVRNNNGGYVNGYALDVFTRRNYLTMTTRDLFPVPSRSALGQRALGLPTVLVTNESSLSDAEDFTEGYRELKVGKTVGQPTAGWIIFTSPQPLIDGSTVRVPGARVEDNRGQTMEGHPRPVDVAVERPLGETETGHDAQLEAAVKVLMGG